MRSLSEPSGAAVDDDRPGPHGELERLVAALVAQPPDRGQQADRGRLLTRLTVLLARSARAAGAGAVASGRWLAETLTEVAPRLPVRDLPTLQAQHPGLDVDGLAAALVDSAVSVTAAVGAAGGAVSAVEWVAPPALLVSSPALVAAETLVVAAVETKLVAELHQVYGLAPEGPAASRGLAYVWAWTHRRGIDAGDPKGLAEALRGAPVRAVRNRVVRRAGRNLPSLAPLLSGAVVAGVTNARETRRLGEQLRDELRARSPYLRP